MADARLSRESLEVIEGGIVDATLSRESLEVIEGGIVDATLSRECIEVIWQLSPAIEFWGSIPA